MSEINNAGIKGYAILGAVIALLLFVILVVYLYQANDYRVPEEPLRYGATLTDGVRALLA